MGPVASRRSGQSATRIVGSDERVGLYRNLENGETGGGTSAMYEFYPFEMERMMSAFEQEVEFNLSESGVHPITLGALLGERSGGAGEACWRPSSTTRTSTASRSCGTTSR